MILNGIIACVAAFFHSGDEIEDLGMAEVHFAGHNATLLQAPISPTFSRSPSSPSQKFAFRVAERNAWASDLDAAQISCMTLSVGHFRVWNSKICYFPVFAAYTEMSLLRPQDLGYHHRDPFTDSSFGATEPFPLLSAEACFALQSGIVLTDKWKDLLCLFSSDRFQNLVNRLIDVSTRIYMGFRILTYDAFLQVPVCLHKNSLSDISLIQTHEGLCCDGSFDSIQTEWQRGGWRKDSAAFTLTILLSHVPEEADGVETLLKTGDNKASRSCNRTLNLVNLREFHDPDMLRIPCFR